MALSIQDLLSITELSVDDVNLILDTARSFKEVFERPIKKVPTLRGRTIVNLFLEPSTRTRTSFEIAGKRLSADVINIGASGSSLVKGESTKDMAKTIEAMNVDAVVIRHWASGAAVRLSQLIEPPVVNAGDGSHQHPTQALLDAYTLLENVPTLEGLRVAIVGDVAHSRVARSLIDLLLMFEAKVTLVGPPMLMPLGIERLAAVAFDLDDVLGDVDVVYLLRIQKERLEDHTCPSLREYSRLFGLTRERWQKVRGRVKLMHPGPINRGVEIDGLVADGDDSLITYQVTNGVAVRMAVLYLLIGGADSE